MAQQAVAERHLDSMGLRKNITSPLAFVFTPGEAAMSTWKLDAP